MKKFAVQNNYEVDATQELIAYGITNIIGVLFNSFAVSGGLARTAVNAESGAKTQVASCITATLMVLSLMFLTTFFYYVPMAVLGAIIEVSVVSMIDFSDMFRAYRLKKQDCLVMVGTFLVTFFVGIIDGLFVGIVLSLAFLFRTTAFPYVAHLGRIDGRGECLYKDISRFSTAEQIPGVALIRMDASLSFVNCEYFQKVVLQAAKGVFHSSPEIPVKKVVLDMSAWIEIDLPGVQTLFDLHEQFSKSGVTLVVACAKGLMRDRLRTCGFVDSLGRANLCATIDEALRGIQSLPSSSALDSAVLETTRLCGYQSRDEKVLESEDSLEDGYCSAEGDRQGDHCIGDADGPVGDVVTFNPVHINLSLAMKRSSYTQLHSESNPGNED